MSLRKSSWLIVLSVMMLAGSGFAQSQDITIAQRSGAAGSIVSLPVTIAANLGAGHLAGVNLRLTYDNSGAIMATGVTTEGTTLLSATDTLDSYSPANGQFNVVAYAPTSGTYFLGNSGTAFNLQFQVSPTAVGGAVYDITLAAQIDGPPITPPAGISDEQGSPTNGYTYNFTAGRITISTVTVSHTLNVASGNPATGVPITVSPLDNGGLGDGTTAFARTYNEGQSITLTAPANFGGNTFQEWQLGGVFYANTAAITFPMGTADMTMTAIYQTPVITYTLTVNSVLPASGVTITVTPLDNNGAGDGPTPLTRVYNANASVTLLAPAVSPNGNTFVKWQDGGGVDLTTNLSTIVTMDANKTAVAVYEVPVVPLTTNTLTILSSTPDSGVSISAAPADVNGLTNAMTPGSLIYYSSSSVTLEAPLTAPGGNSFFEWDMNGAFFSTNATLSNLVITADTTLTAVYRVGPPPAYELTVASANPASGVDITVTPLDNGGAGSGLTQFTRLYNQNTVVTLTAPATATGNNFQEWQLGGATYSSAATINFTVTTTATLTAVYQTPSVQTYTLSVATLDPAAGVTIAISPNDNNGAGAGTAPLSRVYTSGTIVTLTAPATAPNGNTFVKWQKAGVDAGTNAAIQVVMTANTAMTAFYTSSAATVTIAGTVSGATGVTVVTAVNTAGNAVSVTAAADGSFTLTVPSGFSGWVSPANGEFVFHPFRRAYSHITSAKTAQTFTGFACVMNAADLAADYKIIYKKEGRGKDVSATDVTVTSDGGLVILNPGAKDTLMLNRSAAAARAKRIPKAIRSLTTTGGFGNLSTQGDISVLRAGGFLKLTATNAIVSDVLTSGAINAIRMTSRPDADTAVDMITNIVAGASDIKKASVTINGAKVETLIAKDQDLTGVTLSSKLGVVSGLKKVQLSGLVGGAGQTPDVQVKTAPAITVKGASITAFAIVGAIKKLATSSLKLNLTPYMGVIDVFWFRSTADNVTILATSGKIAGEGYYVVSGKITKFGATGSKLYSGSGVVGEVPATGSSLTTSTASGVEVLRVVDAIYVIAGVQPVKFSDIGNVTAPNGLYAACFAGATVVDDAINGLPVTTKLTPNNVGKLPTITASKTIPNTSIARVYATTDVKKKTKVVPNGSPVTLIYNDLP